ncbi:hypothetical protein GXB85_12900 [Cellulomonas sp. APG4]|uniref:CdiA C-terminal domain-containing protein n=1 Tax=Cellulomonas sp. APG4 TaxID=1538656 RepID=UPI00137B1873|nr:hypothetical protein [Cellulomonas sp. APG4]
MTAGTLVLGPVGTTSSLEGAQLLESLAELSEALRSEGWLDAALSGVGVVLDAAAAALDPIGSLISAGLGWLMEHLEPLKGWLTDLTGDAGAVLGFAATWDNIAAELDLAAGDYGRVLRVDLGAMQGEAVGAYVRHGDGMVAQLRGLAGGSGAVAASLRTASGVVQTVRELVRDALADLVGSAISWVLQSVATAGLGTPWVVAQVATRVSSLVARVGGKVTALVGSMSSLRGLVDELGGVLAGLAGVAAKPRGGGVGVGAVVGASRPVALRSSATAPSLAPDPKATPTGRPATFTSDDEPETIRGRTRENQAAFHLARLGYVVEQTPPVPGPKNPDYRIEGRVFDAYSPISDSVRNVWGEVQKKIARGQAPRVVLVLDDSPLSFEAVADQFGTWPMPGLKELIILRNGEILPFWLPTIPEE